MSETQKSGKAGASLGQQSAVPRNGAASIDANERDDIFSEKYAWVAVGACGLASVAFGPEESFKALGPPICLAPGLV